MLEIGLVYVSLECGPMTNVMVALPNIGAVEICRGASNYRIDLSR